MLPRVLWSMDNEPILKYFSYTHLPERLQTVSKVYADAAAALMVLVPVRSAERTVSLRKLLEAKDAGVRASMEAA